MALIAKYKRYGFQSAHSVDNFSGVGLKNNLIVLMDQTWPGVNTFFGRPVRSDGRQKWVDFACSFWHVDCVYTISEAAFVEKYRRRCKQRGYNSSQRKPYFVYMTAGANKLLCIYYARIKEHLNALGEYED